MAAHSWTCTPNDPVPESPLVTFKAETSGICIELVKFVSKKWFTRLIRPPGLSPTKLGGRLITQGNELSVWSNGVSQMYVNSGRIQETVDWSAPESRKITTRFPEEIIEPRVGQEVGEEGVVLNGGVYANSEIPSVSKSAAHDVTGIPSSLVNRIVKTRRD